MAEHTITGINFGVFIVFMLCTILCGDVISKIGSIRATRKLNKLGLWIVFLAVAFGYVFGSYIFFVTWVLTYSS